MKEHYIKQVKRELLISRRQKNDVLRDLDEVFTSAMEHGETEQQVIERLGSPKDFAISTEEQLGIDRTALRKRNNIIFIIISIGVSVLAFVLFGTLHSKQLPDGVIGQADAMTNIRINGAASKKDTAARQWKRWKQPLLFPVRGSRKDMNLKKA